MFLNYLQINWKPEASASESQSNRRYFSLGLPCSQTLPWYPGWHWHIGPLVVATQTPSWRQGNPSQKSKKTDIEDYLRSSCNTGALPSEVSILQDNFPYAVTLTNSQEIFIQDFLDIQRRMFSNFNEKFKISTICLMIFLIGSNIKLHCILVVEELRGHFLWKTGISCWRCCSVLYDITKKS